MALPQSSWSLPTEPISSNRPTEVTTEEFKIFHMTDRQLFSRMVFSIGRNISESIQVIAFWIWLERVSCQYLVEDILTFSDLLIDSLINETLICLKLAETETFPFTDGHGVDIPFLQSLSKKDISLRYFHDNRVAMLKAVGKIMQDVCLRAFSDIIQAAFIQAPGGTTTTAAAALIEAPDEAHGGEIHPPLASSRHFGYNFSHNIKVGDFNLPMFLPTNVSSSSSVGGGGDGSGHCNPPLLSIDPCSFNSQPQAPQRELAELLDSLRISYLFEGEKRELPLDDRTIFLTFSKGYPISGPEIREYFTRAFGDVIEALHMQDVPFEEQALYARLVIRDPKKMDEILGGQGKAKFSINGKHVWARKYVHKNTRGVSFAPCTEKLGGSEF
ncbi:hypothetical protein Dimus_021160 [Dionaea muscipula]